MEKSPFTQGSPRSRRSVTFSPSDLVVERRVRKHSMPGMAMLLGLSHAASKHFTNLPVRGQVSSLKGERFSSRDRCNSSGANDESALPQSLQQLRSSAGWLRERYHSTSGSLLQHAKSNILVRDNSASGHLPNDKFHVRGKSCSGNESLRELQSRINRSQIPRSAGIFDTNTVPSCWQEQAEVNTPEVRGGFPNLNSRDVATVDYSPLQYERRPSRQLKLSDRMYKSIFQRMRIGVYPSPKEVHPSPIISGSLMGEPERSATWTYGGSPHGEIHPPVSSGLSMDAASESTPTVRRQLVINSEGELESAHQSQATYLSGSTAVGCPDNVLQNAVDDHQSTSDPNHIMNYMPSSQLSRLQLQSNLASSNVFSLDETTTVYVATGIISEVPDLTDQHEHDLQLGDSLSLPKGDSTAGSADITGHTETKYMQEERGTGSFIRKISKLSWLRCCSRGGNTVVL